MTQGCVNSLKCPPHIVDIDAPSPGVVGCVLQLTGALASRNIKNLRPGVIFTDTLGYK